MSKESKEQLKENLSSILDIIVCLILFIMSLYKGGFYKVDTTFSNIAIGSFGIIMLIVKLIRNIKNNNMVTKSWIINILDFLVMVMPVSYLLPIILKTNANTEGSITEFLTYLNFSIIYFIVRSTKNKNYYMNTIIVIGTVLAILGIDELTTRTLENVFATISVSYVTKETGRLAATLQYANVTALVILLAAELCIYKIIRLSKQEEYMAKYKNPVYTFLLILLSSCVFLTSSRMATILLGIAYISMAIYLYKNKEKGSLIAKITVCLPITIILTDIIERYINQKEYTKVAIIYLIIFAIIWLIEVILKKIIQKVIQNIKIVSIKKIAKWKIITFYLVIITIIAILIYFINAPLKVIAEGEKEIVGRNIYTNFCVGQNDIKMQINNTKNAEYKIYFYEVYEDFTRKCIADINNMNIINNDDGSSIITCKINVSKNVKNLRMSITVNKGTVDIINLRINDSNIKLSYYIIPDSLIFKLQDTFMHDQNNKLRAEYYKDAIKLIKLSPVVGIGGEGFLARYQEVQDETYISSEAHSSVLQIGVETGIIGTIVFLLILILAINVMLKAIKVVDDKDFIFTLFILLISYIVTSLFDISMSFQLLVLILAVIIGIGCSYYFEKIKQTKDNVYKMDNKSNMALMNICLITTSFVVTIFATYYSYDVYRASLIRAEYEALDAESEIESSYTKVSLYEQKLLYDKYNVEYALKLNELYENQITMLEKIKLTESEKKVKKSLETEITKYLTRQKMLIDNLIEYDYYDKYVLNDAARCYFDNFMSYATIYEKNFTTQEVAYAFYLGYAIKLTDRISEVGPNNKVAKETVINIYEHYEDSLTNKNKYIKSEVIESVLKDIRKKLEKTGE